MHPIIHTKLLTSLEKVFPHICPKGTFTHMPSIFKNEAFSFQVAYTSESGNFGDYPVLSIDIESPLKDFISIKSVGLVPSELPAPFHCDDDYLCTTPGLFPDPLLPLESLKVKVLPLQWRALWIELKSTTDLPPGTHPISIYFKNKENEVVASETLVFKIIDAYLPKQRLIHTEWFHVDCLSNFYTTKVFSEKHWELIENFLHTASSHGINMILTPLFTPPLDTEIGGERPTVQLIDVSIQDGSYAFSFDKLDRWITTCQRVGIEYFEMSHLFTQWGATSIPKIMATVEGTYQKLFGWGDSALDPRYKSFLEDFLPQLVTFITSRGIRSCCYFHISDEPSLTQVDTYKKAKALVKDILQDFPIIDALSNIEFYKSSAIDLPIPSNDHIGAFIDADVPNLWTYYCCAQYKKVSNRFMSMPSYRNRIIATQLFKYDIAGFLHWGYNFWNTQFSKKAIDPFKITDAGQAFPSGDAFLVYPGNNEAIESIRLKVFAEALYDLRAMDLLATLTSKEYVMNLIEGDLLEPITFNQYPKSQDYILNLRFVINEHIIKHL
ncbi:MAG: DUF4091 domain-containing protein [Cellulosilyticaceae bacterium]